MKTAAAFLMALALSGCGAAPPEHFSIDSRFAPDEAATIRDTFAAWCDAVGYCPTEVMLAERGHVALVPDLDDRGMAAGDSRREVVARNSGDGIRVAANRSFTGLEVLWLSVAHEIGHYCTEHTDTGLMGALQTSDNPLIVDETAAAAWRAGCAD